MWSTYVLYNSSRSVQKFYIGVTNNLFSRIEKHQKGKVYFTHQDSQNWQLVYFETYLSKEDAIRREQSLKNHGQAFRQLKERIKESINLIK